MRWNQYLLSYAYKFCREYKTTNILLDVKIQAKYVYDKSFLNKYKLHEYNFANIHSKSFTRYRNNVTQWL